MEIWILEVCIFMLNFEEFLLIRFERFINSTYGTFIRNIRVVGYCWKMWKSIGITNELLPWKVFITGSPFPGRTLVRDESVPVFWPNLFVQIYFVFTRLFLPFVLLTSMVLISLGFFQYVCLVVDLYFGEIFTPAEQ